MAEDFPQPAPKEILEAKLTELYERMVEGLLDKAKAGTLTAAEAEIARKLTQNIGDSSPKAKAKELVKNLPYSSVDEEIE